MTDDATQVLIFLGIIAVFAIIWAIFENLGAVEEGTLEERERNPSLNTNDWDLHWKRLDRFEYSKYEGETYFKGKRGGIYTITANGNRNYKY